MMDYINGGSDGNEEKSDKNEQGAENKSSSINTNDGTNKHANEDISALLQQVDDETRTIGETIQTFFGDVFQKSDILLLQDIVLYCGALSQRDKDSTPFSIDDQRLDQRYELLKVCNTLDSTSNQHNVISDYDQLERKKYIENLLKKYFEAVVLYKFRNKMSAYNENNQNYDRNDKDTDNKIVIGDNTYTICDGPFNRKGSSLYKIKHTKQNHKGWNHEYYFNQTTGKSYQSMPGFNVGGLDLKNGTYLSYLPFEREDVLGFFDTYWKDEKKLRDAIHLDDETAVQELVDYFTNFIWEVFINGDSEHDSYLLNFVGDLGYIKYCKRLHELNGAKSHSGDLGMLLYDINTLFEKAVKSYLTQRSEAERIEPIKLPDLFAYIFKECHFFNDVLQEHRIE